MALSIMEREAAQSAHCVARLLEANKAVIRKVAKKLQAIPPRIVFFCGRGSSGNSTIFGRYLIERELHLPTASVWPSTYSVYDATPDLRGCVALFVSQSGSSPDVIEAAAKMRSFGAETVVIVNNSDSALAAHADTLIDLCASPEKSVAATKSVISSFCALSFLISEWTKDTASKRTVASLPGVLEAAPDEAWTSVGRALSSAANIFVLGRGPSWGTASEIALKLVECCGVPAQAFSAAEFQHGPMSLATSKTPVLVCQQASMKERESEKLITRLRADGVPVYWAGTNISEESLAMGVVHLPCLGDDDYTMAVSQLRSAYSMVGVLARLKQRDPDCPPRLSKVTETH